MEHDRPCHVLRRARSRRALVKPISTDVPSDMPWEHDAAITEVAQLFDRVARQLLEAHQMTDTLARIVQLAVETLDACEFAGISFVEGQTVTSPASSGEVPEIVDRIQSETQEGPCIDAIKMHHLFITGDLAAESRWPQFSARAHRETGVSSILSLRLFAAENTMGSLNLYSTRKDAFGTTDIALGEVFATHAAVAMAASRQQEGLLVRAEHRDVIGQAKGVIMASTGCSPEAAFGVLVRQSQHENRKVYEIAAEVAARADRSRRSPISKRSE